MNTHERIIKGFSQRRMSREREIYKKRFLEGPLDVFPRERGRGKETKKNLLNKVGYKKKVYYERKETINNSLRKCKAELMMQKIIGFFNRKKCLTIKTNSISKVLLNSSATNN